jgi:isoleucyl-tRNA synthetase
MTSKETKNFQAPDIEEKILNFWHKKNIFKKTLKKTIRQKAFVFFDGPPFATGLPHYGHFLASFIKDTIPRYQTMQGKYVERRWGWDCHGLPIENQIEEQLNLKTKKDIEKIGIDKFNETAQNKVLQYAEDWKKIIPRIGRWVDMDNPYKTMDPEYTESVWWIFKTLFEKQLIYEGFKSMHICPRCETTLSNFEVALGYKNIEDSSIIVKFEINSPKNTDFQNKTYFLVWTTTPWTLPANTALAINPNIEYSLIETIDKKEKYILAKNRLIVLKIPFRELKVLKGSSLINIQYKPLFDYYKNNLNNYQNGWKIYPADFVEINEGTGIIHIAPAFGADDMKLGQKENLPFIQHVTIDGKFKKEIKDFANLPVKPKGNHRITDNKIILWLQKKECLLENTTIVHPYPHCWRCDTPLLNYAATSWFLKITSIKNQLLENNKQINWTPNHLKYGRFQKILEEAPDWAISRSRFWGAPLPVWRCSKPTQNNKKKTKSKNCGNIKVIGSLEELKKTLSQSNNQYFLMRHGQSISNIKNICSSNYQTSQQHPLTAQGKREAEKAADKLKNCKIDIIFSSDLLRAQETALIVAKVLKLPPQKVIFDQRIREINTGIFDNQNVEQYRNYATLSEKFFQAPPQGENLNDVKRRVTEFLYTIDQHYKNKNILIISHEYPLWLMTSGAQGANAQKALLLKKEREKKTKTGEYLATGEIMKINFQPIPHNKNYELDLHRPYIDEIVFPCSCGGEMKRINEVFDCWFESGSMPYGQCHYPFENKKKFEDNFPAEFIAEGIDQTRGWFYTLHVLATALFNKPAFKNVIANGTILAEDGQKMSKRLKNYPDPIELVNKYGADALRLYLLSSPAVKAEDLNFSEKNVEDIYKKAILRLINVYNFYSLYAASIKINKNLKSKPTNILEKWILAKIKTLNITIQTALNSYELDKATRSIINFIDDLSNWYIRRSREKFRQENKNKIKTILFTKDILIEYSKIAAPFLPFLSEWLYQNLTNGKKLPSVHIESWPKRNQPTALEQKIMQEMTNVRERISQALEIRNSLGIKSRQPLSAVIFKEKIPKQYHYLIKEELNVKKILFLSAKTKTEQFVWNTTQTIGLDTKITPILKAEGELRELARITQDLRQKARYQPQNKIILWIEAPKEISNLIKNNLKSFQNKIGAKKIEFCRSQKFDAEINTKIDSINIWLAIKKI